MAADARACSDFSLADFDFVHMPGGHAPMVDFHDNAWMGELLHTLREGGVPISLMCHAPIALTSARYRVGPDGAVSTNQEHEFKGATITTVPKYGERVMLSVGYPKVAVPHVPARGLRPDSLERTLTIVLLGLLAD